MTDLEDVVGEEEMTEGGMMSVRKIGMNMITTMGMKEVRVKMSFLTFPTQVWHALQPQYQNLPLLLKSIKVLVDLVEELVM